MEDNFRYLRTSVLEALELLRHEAAGPHVHHAIAVLQAALIHLHHNDIAEVPHQAEGLATPESDWEIEEAVEEVPANPAIRNLREYRAERGMTLIAFAEWLGISLPEYAQVIHRQKVDRRLRDQIAFKLGTNWWEIAEFLPARPQSWPKLEPIPAAAGEPLPAQPWYLVDMQTGRIESGPHYEPVPENGAYLVDLATNISTHLVALMPPNRTEEDALPPDGYDRREWQRYFGNGSEEDLHAAEFREVLAALAEPPGGLRLL